MLSKKSKFSPNPEADFLHRKGVTLSVAGEFDAAVSTYNDALVIIDDSDEFGESSRRVQVGRVMRDLGFVSVRRALAENDPGILEEAKGTLEASGRILRNVSDQSLSRDEMEFLFAEHGATIGLLGRMYTAKVVLMTQKGKYLGLDSFDFEAQERYLEAHNLVIQGSNYYYRTSNAINSARHEMLMTRNLETVKWLSRAVLSCAGAQVFDRDKTNGRASVKTLIGRIPQLRTPTAAMNSVIVKP